MRIAVTDIGRTFGRQTRAYAEYRIFSSLSRFGHVVRDVDVSLTSTAGDESNALCVVIVTISSGIHLEVRAIGRHAYDAINRAAERIAAVVRGHAGIPLLS